MLPTQKCSLSHSSALYKHLNWTEIVTSHSEVTYPLLRLLQLGPMLRSLGHRDGEESERIFERPPLPWRVSRGATGVKTPDNQSGILKSHNQHQFKTRKQNKNKKYSVWRKLISTFVIDQVCGPNVQPVSSATWLMYCLGTDCQRGLTVSGLSRFEAKQRPTDSPVDRPGAKCAWGHGWGGGCLILLDS